MIEEKVGSSCEHIGKETISWIYNTNSTDTEINNS